MGDARQIVATLAQIVQWLRGRCAAIVLLTLPPIARAARNSAHWRILNHVNKWIMEQSCGKLVRLSIRNKQKNNCFHLYADKVVPVEIHRLFLLRKRCVKYCFFER